MDPELRTVKVGCHCGNVRFAITLPEDEFPLPAHFCHCESCRRITGQLAYAGVAIPAKWQPEQSLLSKLHRYVFTENVTHLFCSTCGTTVMCECKSEAQCLGAQGEGLDYVVNMGVFEEGNSSIFRIQKHIFIGDTLDGGFADFLTDIEGEKLERYENYIDGDVLPLYWSSSQRAQVRQPGKNERLHGHCKCGGVQFWVAQPSRRSLWPQEAFEGKDIPDGFPEETRLTLKADWTKFPAAICPCDSCRLAANGMAFATWAYIPTVDVSLDAEGEIPIPQSLQWGTLEEYSFSDRTSQHFCGVCSASVFWDTKARPWIKDFGLGLFDSSCGARCESCFSWKVGQMNHREDGLRWAKSLTLAVEGGLQQYEKNVQSKLPSGESRF